MNRFHPFRRVMAPILALALAFTLSLPASAFFWNKKESAAVNDFSKNGLIGTIISFSLEDFAVTGDKKTQLTAITIESLPDPGAGTLVIGGQPLQVGTVVDCTALDGLRFQSSPVPTVTTTTFTFTPSLAPTQDCGPVTVTLYLLDQENQAPIARNMELSTYKNVAITGYFDAVDSEGDALSFQLTSTPARGAVTLAEDGSSQFVYTPYENKTGKDSFTYVAVDAVGNSSDPATVKIKIEKPNTKVTYADMDGDPAHKAAIRLAGHERRRYGSPGGRRAHRLCRRCVDSHLGQALCLLRAKGGTGAGQPLQRWAGSVPGGGAHHRGRGGGAPGPGPSGD